MKLVIDIPEKIYELCQRDTCYEPIRNGKTLYRTVWEAVANGKPADKEMLFRYLDGAADGLNAAHEDFVSIEAVIEWLKDQDIIKMKWQEENARSGLAKLSSVAPESDVEE